MKFQNTRAKENLGRRRIKLLPHEAQDSEQRRLSVGSSRGRCLGLLEESDSHLNPTWSSPNQTVNQASRIRIKIIWHTQNKRITLRFWRRWTSKTGLTGLTSRCQQGCVASGGSSESASSPLQLVEAACSLGSWPWAPLHGQQHRIFRALTRALPPPSCENPCDDTGPTPISQGNLPSRDPWSPCEAPLSRSGEHPTGIRMWASLGSLFCLSHKASTFLSPVHPFSRNNRGHIPS